MAVLVVIHKAASVVPARARTVLSEARLLRHVGEGAITVVVIKSVLTPVCDEEVVPTVVVEVSDAHSLTPTSTRQPRLRGHVGECPIAIVMIQMAGRRFAVGKTFQHGGAYLEDVGPAILIVIIKGDAAARRLDDPALGVRIAGNTDRFQARLRCDVG